MGRFSYFGNTISIDIDVEDVLNQIADNDIIEYVNDNNLIEESKEITANSEQQLVSVIEYVMNHNGQTSISRTKEELKKYVCDIIDYWHKSVN